MASDRYPLHHRSEVDVAADVQRVFAHLDDHRRLASHMEKPSLMMAGATLRVETDELKGQAVGSVTRGEPRLLVIGACRMGFTIAAQGDRSRLLVFIDYQLPARGSRVGLRCCSVGPMRPGAPGAWPPMRWLRSLACRTDEAAAFQRFAPHSAAWGNPCLPAQCRFDRIGPNLRARLAFEHRLDLFERADQRPPARRLRETGGRFDLGTHRTFGELVARQLARRQLAQGSLPRPPPVEIDPWRRQEDRVAVGCRFRNQFGADVADRAGLVLDDDGAAHAGLHRGREEAPGSGVSGRGRLRWRGEGSIGPRQASRHAGRSARPRRQPSARARHC